MNQFGTINCVSYLCAAKTKHLELLQVFYIELEDIAIRNSSCIFFRVWANLLAVVVYPKHTKRFVNTPYGIQRNLRNGNTT